MRPGFPPKVCQLSTKPHYICWTPPRQPAIEWYHVAKHVITEKSGIVFANVHNDSTIILVSPERWKWGSLLQKCNLTVFTITISQQFQIWFTVARSGPRNTFDYGLWCR